jgi:hypothetical protein
MRRTSSGRRALVWPSAALGRLGDPVAYARGAGSPLPVDTDTLLRHVRTEVARLLRPLLDTAPRDGREDLRWYPVAVSELDRQLGADLRHSLTSAAWTGSDGADAVLDSHLQALPAIDDDLGRPPADLTDVLARLAVGGPGPVAWRGLHRLSSRFGWDADDVLLGTYAARLAWGLRSVLSGAEVTAIVRGAAPYWRAALDHCLDGDLSGVLDEYLHLLPDQQRVTGSDAASALDAVVRAAVAAMTLPASRISADVFAWEDGGCVVGICCGLTLLRAGGGRLEPRGEAERGRRSAICDPGRAGCLYER